VARLTVQDKLALMMTATSSQRELAAFIGISHQRVGRWLRFGYEGGAKRLPTDPETLDLIDTAFEMHTEVCKAQAKEDGLPFTRELPTFTHRLWRQKQVRHVDPETGEITQRRVVDQDGNPVMVPGDRVSVGNTGWISNELRARVIAHNRDSGRYAFASVGSMVNLALYNKRANERFRDTKRTPDQRRYQKLLLKKAREQTNGWVFTRYAPMSPDDEFDNEEITDFIDDQLAEKHEPATGTPGTSLASQILLQVDTREKASQRRTNRSTRRRT
jgi:hypothetical protein